LEIVAIDMMKLLTMRYIEVVSFLETTEFLLYVIHLFHSVFINPDCPGSTLFSYGCEKEEKTLCVKRDLGIVPR